MSKTLPVPRPQSTVLEKPYGECNPLRGANHVDAAMAFVAEFPIGSILSPERFDDWAHKKGFLNVPDGARKSSDAWLAHLQRRHQLHYNINKAATHRRMDVPFAVEFVRNGMWEVRPPHISIAKTKITQRVESLLGTKRKQLDYLMQSADWNVLPPHERIFAESLYDDLDMYQQQIELHTRNLSNKFSKLESKIKRAVESGEIKPQNGGIRRLLGIESSDD